MEKRKKKRLKAVRRLVISLSAIIILYFSTTMYFTERFYFGSAINSVNISGKTVKEAGEEIASQIDSYSLELEKSDGSKEQINGSEIALKYNEEEHEIQELKDKQNPFKWFISLFDSKDHELDEIISFDEELLNVCIGNLKCLDSNNVIQSKNPSFQYTDNGYEIVDEVYGDSINRDILKENIIKAIKDGKTKLNLIEIKCYEKPQYTKESEDVVETRDLLNKYISAHVTYDLGSKKDVLDGATINTWIEVDNNLNIIFNENKVTEYVNKLAQYYNTAGSTRDFVTSVGATVKVKGGDYGWLMNITEEVQDLIVIVKGGENTTKEPRYIQRGITRGINDIGDTYVEINLTTQHIWFYKDGSLVVDSGIVTGNVTQGHATPGGTYILKYKQRDAILRGTDYASPVSYWMPFNGGIGLHDANWRSEFGGNIYIAGGSHGCVNLPVNVAATIFNSIDAGTPIVCYF